MQLVSNTFTMSIAVVATRTATLLVVVTRFTATRTVRRTRTVSRTVYTVRLTIFSVPIRNTCLAIGTGVVITVAGTDVLTRLYRTEQRSAKPWIR